MLIKLNKILRVLIVVTGALALILKLADKDRQHDTQDEGFQTREFDDIW